MVPSTVFRSIRADDDLPGARRRSDPKGDPWTLYGRAASTMDPAAAASHQVAAARDRQSATPSHGYCVCWTP